MPLLNIRWVEKDGRSRSAERLISMSPTESVTTFASAKESSNRVKNTDKVINDGNISSGFKGRNSNKKSDRSPDGNKQISDHPSGGNDKTTSKSLKTSASSDCGFYSESTALPSSISTAKSSSKPSSRTSTPVNTPNNTGLSTPEQTSRQADGPSSSTKSSEKRRRSSESSSTSAKRKSKVSSSSHSVNVKKEPVEMETATVTAQPSADNSQPTKELENNEQPTGQCKPLVVS